jgi:hypothetical protein
VYRGDNNFIDYYTDYVSKYDGGKGGIQYLYEQICGGSWRK